jgi:hypothetical protein
VITNPSTIKAGTNVTFSATTDKAATRVTISIPDANITREMSGNGTNWSFSTPFSQAGSRKFVVTAYDSTGKDGSKYNGNLQINK